MLLNKTKCYKKLFCISAFFGRFSTKKQQKLTKNEENWQNPNHLMKFSEIWYVDASQQRKCYKKTFFGFPPFLAVFQPKNSQKNNLPKSKTFCYVDASQQRKCYKKTFFGFRPFLAVF